MDSIQQEQMLNKYCSNEMQKLKKMCYPKICKIGGISQMDYDDLYSIALDVLRYSVERYDSSQNCKFSTYLSGNIDRKYSTYVRDKLREKRSGEAQYDEDGNRVFNQTVSLDDCAEDGTDLNEKIASDFKIEDNLSEQMCLSSDERVDKYLNSLSNKQRDIAELAVQGYKPFEIREKLNLTEKQYTDLLKDMKTFEKSRILKHKNHVQTEEEKQMQVQTQTSEKSKETQYSTASLIKKIESYTFRFDHPTQRQSGQWTPKMKSNLISDILQNNPLPQLVFAEQIIDGLVVIWNLDGKQKSTTTYEFSKDDFKIAKKVRRWNIEYQTSIRDESGNVKIFENGMPRFEKKFFDIRGKKFSDLPEELKERFLDYTFQCVQYLNCTDEDIEYHICRYNEGKPMNVAQKGMGNIGTKYAALVKEISAMPFFKDCGNYTASEFRNGSLERIVVESVMATNFLDDWKKSTEEMCCFMKDNATETNFENFTDMIDRLEKVTTEEVTEMFNAKDSFLWFGLFARFVDTGKEDEKFIEFMAEFTRSLHSKVVDGTTYDELCIDKTTGNARSTKDKYIVVPKMELLEKLMYEFLGVEKEEIVTEEENTLENIEKFIADCVDMEVEELHEDMDFYNQSLDDLLEVIKNDNSKLLHENNRPSLLAMMVYSFKEDVDLENWMKEYSENNNTYFIDQRKNFVHMKNNLENYLNSEGEVA